MITLFKDPFFDVFDKVFDTSYVGSLSPQVNVRKNENNYKLFISVPGLTKEDLKITTKDGVLVISFEQQEKTDKTHFVSNFKKSYTLPDDVKEKDIEGKVENGILELTLPIDRKKSLERLISLN
jgi:HSP20 family protein